MHLRLRPWAASFLLHGLLLALLHLFDRPAAPGPDELAALNIEVLAPSARDESADRAQGSGEPEGAAPAGPRRPVRTRRARVRAPQPTRPGPEAEATPPGPKAEGGSAPGGGGLGLGWGLGELGTGTGTGAGGSGGGRGVGRSAKPVAAPARPRSKARPPRLVYPKRFREERPGEVFVALLTVDEDGWVVGVRLLRGVNPHADQKALTAVWRFHYEPALDRAGRPIKARVEQRFMVD